jgi:hypothetical protein
MKVKIMENLQGYRLIYSFSLIALSFISATFFMIILFIETTRGVSFFSYVFLGQIIILLSIIAFTYLTITGYLKGNIFKMKLSIMLAIFPLFNPLFMFGNFLFFKDKSKFKPRNKPKFRG